MLGALHFVGFGDPAQYQRAVRVFGWPDFFHRNWDIRARVEIMPGDTAVFPVVRMRFGSDLYGTRTQHSDTDYKGVYLPSARDILLQRVKGSVVRCTKADQSAKNTAADSDEEMYSLQRFLELLAEGQTNLVDMLFAPPDMLIETTALWEEICANRSRLLTSRSAAFVGYCRQQANKYGIKGSRVKAARTALAILQAGEAEYGTQAKLREIEPAMREASEGVEFLTFDTTVLAHGNSVTHWDVCGRKLCFTASIKSGRECVARLVAEYGQRALAAEKEQGIDWKALSHAVRVGREALELLSTGFVTFPLPYAKHIVAIKLGELPYAKVAAEIEDLLLAVECNAETSLLPSAPDVAFMDELVMRAYAEEILVECAVERAVKELAGSA